ncbi:hypothetical protein FDP41_012861 [Naegleria fowleri]|uniref:peptidylprolyl isomerase n=1 Tax=Naegleria fowleri TaxID=5763 RepID=A0A6A5BSN1_NAEFO|nr:uncharacterized protein FDP41_012861 [Naegleria fowleri]KAF0981073.1 hypothetical protein FDP41_012861 [Naegleria fowleri]
MNKTTTANSKDIAQQSSPSEMIQKHPQDMNDLSSKPLKRQEDATHYHPHQEENIKKNVFPSSTLLTRLLSDLSSSENSLHHHESNPLHLPPSLISTETSESIGSTNNTLQEPKTFANESKILNRDNICNDHHQTITTTTTSHSSISIPCNNNTSSNSTCAIEISTTTTTSSSSSVSSEIMLKAFFNPTKSKNSTNSTNTNNNSPTVMYDTTTSSQRLASGLGLTKKETSQENVEFDLLYATKLSSISNRHGSSRRHKKKSSSVSSAEKINQFCKFCKISESRLEKKNLTTSVRKEIPKLKTCSLCREVRYCCKEHQVEDWPNHKIDCNSAVRARNNGIYSRTLKKGHSKYRPCEGDVVSIHYVARLLNGTIVDKTYKSIETNKYCSISYDTSDDEDTENAFDDDDNDPYIVKPPSNVYNDFEGWLTHANIQQRKSFTQFDDELSIGISESDSTEETTTDLTNVTASFSENTHSFLSLDNDQLSLRSTTSTAASSMISTDSNPERNFEQQVITEDDEAQDNWSDSSSGRAGGGTSSSTSNATIIFDSLQKDVEVVPDPLQFKIGKGQVPSGVEKAVKQMSLGERCYLVVAPSKESKRDVISKRMKNANGYTIVYEIMLVHILRKRQHNEFDFETTNNENMQKTMDLIRLEEFMKDDDSYQSCYYEPFRPFLANVSSLSAQLY